MHIILKKKSRLIVTGLLVITIAVLLYFTVFATDVRIYEFTTDQPSASQTFGGTFIDKNPVSITVRKLEISGATTYVHFTIYNATSETASIHMTEPTLVVGGNQISTTTFAIGTDVVPSASRDFIYSFRTELKDDSIFDLTMSIFVPKAGAETITVKGIDLSKAAESLQQEPVNTPNVPPVKPSTSPTFPFSIFTIFLIIALLLNAAIAIAVYVDAKRNGIKPALVWAFVSLIGSGFGLIIYLIIRYTTKRDRSIYGSNRFSTNEPAYAYAGYWNPQDNSNSFTNYNTSDLGIKKFCPYCGSAIEQGYTFCKHCGAKT